MLTRPEDHALGRQPRKIFDRSTRATPSPNASTGGMSEVS
jgi:hypothetical protein